MPSDGDYLGSWDKLKNMVDDAGSKSAGRGAPGFGHSVVQY